MPELPEVETTVEGLKLKVLGRTFVDVWSDWEKLVKKSKSFLQFRKEIKNKKIKSIWRRAKNIIFDLKPLHFIDQDGIDALEEIIELLHGQKKVVAIIGANPFISKMLEESNATCFTVQFRTKIDEKDVIEKLSEVKETEFNTEKRKIRL